MRVCMLAYTFYESDGRVMRYAQTLRRKGHHVDVISLRQEGQEKQGVVDGVHVFRIQKRVVDEKGRSAYVFRLLRFFFKSMVFLSRRHLKSRYDLIHVHSVPDFLVFAAWLPKWSGSKIILDIHDLLPEFYAGKFKCERNSVSFRLLAAVEQMSAAFADHVIAANDIWQNTLVSRSVPKSKCTAILNFPDRSIFFRRGRTKTDNKFRIIYPGTLNYHQGVDIAVRAFARITNQVPTAEFHIYGMGDLMPVLADLIEAYGLQERVFLNGFVPANEISIIMENADLGVVPKRNDSFGNEAFSTKILEFMSLGVPVLVADTKVDRYYFNESIVKFFRSGDEEDLAASMLAMILDQQFRNRQAKNAEAFVKQNSWELKEQLYIRVIESLLPSQVAAPPVGSAQGPSSPVAAAELAAQQAVPPPSARLRSLNAADTEIPRSVGTRQIHFRS